MRIDQTKQTKESKILLNFFNESMYSSGENLTKQLGLKGY